MEEDQRIARLTYHEAQRECVKRKLVAKGSKAELMKRLREVPASYSVIARKDLQTQCKKAGIPARAKNQKLREDLAQKGRHDTSLKSTFTIKENLEDAIHWLRRLGRENEGKRIRVTAIDGGFRPAEGENRITSGDFRNWIVNDWNNRPPINGGTPRTEIEPRLQDFFDTLGAHRVHQRFSNKDEPVRVLPFGLTWLDTCDPEDEEVLPDAGCVQIEKRWVRRMLSHEYDFTGSAGTRSKVLQAALESRHWSDGMDSSHEKLQLLYPGDRIECIVIDEMSRETSSAIAKQYYAHQLVGNCVLDPMIAHFTALYDQAQWSKSKTAGKQMERYRRAMGLLHDISNEVGGDGVSRERLQQFVDDCKGNPRVTIRMHQPPLHLGRIRGVFSVQARKSVWRDRIPFPQLATGPRGFAGGR